MKVLIALIVLLALPAQAASTPDWESCLDAEDYHLPLSLSFLADGSISKKGCEFRVVDLGKESRKFVFDVCDSDVSIAVFRSIDGTASDRYRATSANCSVPMFGIDIDVPEGDAEGFQKARDQILAFLTKAEKSKGPQTKQRLACARVLISSYLDDCVSFEANPKAKTVSPVERKNVESLQSPVNIPGIHPQTILKKKD